jgi:hypothetical protein
MKHSTSFQLQFALILLLLLPIAVSAQNKSNSNLKQTPYPVLKSTGNPAHDKQAFERAVKEWNQNELIRNQEINKIQNTPLSNDVKDDVLISKNLERKKSQSKESELTEQEVPIIRQTTIIDLPTYPKYVFTGNFELDEKNYQMSKAKWMNENPEVYKNYLEELRKQTTSTLKRIDHTNSSN